MRIDWWTLALQAINVLVLVWLLSRFLYRPVMKIIAARQSAAAALLADAQSAKDAATREGAALKAQNDAFAMESEKRRAEMRAAVEDERARMLAQLKADAEAAAQQSARAAEAEEARRSAEWREKADLLAVTIAETLLRRMDTAQAVDAMFAALVGQLRALSEPDRRKLADDAPLSVLTATPIAASDLPRYLGPLRDLLPDTPMDFAVDPGLIAGFELRGTHMRLRNSWRADLDAVLASLREDDNARLS